VDRTGFASGLFGGGGKGLSREEQCKIRDTIYTSKEMRDLWSQMFDNNFQD